jgi:hypothetical protein
VIIVLLFKVFLIWLRIYRINIIFISLLLGLNTFNINTARPTQITKGEEKEKKTFNQFEKINIVQLSSMGNTSMALSNEGIIYEWGEKHYYGGRGPLEFKAKEILGPIPSQRKPQKRLESLKNIKVKMIACGYFHQLLLTEDGDVYSLGDNK